MKRVHRTERKKNSVDPQDSVHRLCRSDSHALSDNCRNDGLGRAETHQAIKRHPTALPSILGRFTRYCVDGGGAARRPL
jgi:hypothetical protein